MGRSRLLRAVIVRRLVARKNTASVSTSVLHAVSTVNAVIVKIPADLYPIYYYTILIQSNKEKQSTTTDISAQIERTEYFLFRPLNGFFFALSEDIRKWSALLLCSPFRLFIFLSKLFFFVFVAVENDILFFTVATTASILFVILEFFPSLAGFGKIFVEFILIYIFNYMISSCRLDIAFFDAFVDGFPRRRLYISRVVI